MKDATVLVTLAFVIVWMKRKDRWKLLFQAMEGKVALSGTATSSIGS
jgi:hypothetical protein